MRKTVKLDPRLKHRTEAEALSAQPLIIRVNKFDEDSAKQFTADMSTAHGTGQPVIPVVIDSYGGQAYALLSMLTEVENSRLPVATIVEGKAMSCGALLFGMGAIGMRYAGENSVIMIHEVASVCFGKVEDLKADTREAERINQTVYKKLARHCGKPAEYFLELMHRKKNADLYLTPEKAKRHGLVDHVRVPELKVVVTVDVQFE